MASNPPGPSGSPAVASFRAQLGQLSAGGVAHRDLGERYRAVLENILCGQLGENDLVDGLKVFIEAIVNENVSLVISRQLLSEVSSRLTRLQVINSFIPA